MNPPRVPSPTKRDWLALIAACQERGLAIVELVSVNGELRATVASADAPKGGSYVHKWKAKSARREAGREG